ncbi:MAG: hypothetical protein ACK4UN_19105 [Limisphaerales bacterium]
METLTAFHKSDWVRFQVSDGRVLEGYVQALSPDGSKVRIGKTPDSTENEWHRLDELSVLKTQSINTPY